jgi:hypothetical protein
MVDGKLFYIKNLKKKKQYLKHDFNLGLEIFKKHLNELMIQLLGQPLEVEHSFS